MLHVKGIPCNNRSIPQYTKKVTGQSAGMKSRKPSSNVSTALLTTMIVLRFTKESGKRVLIWGRKNPVSMAVRKLRLLTAEPITDQGRIVSSLNLDNH